MIITKLKGGIGNQMFQYAAGLSLSKKLNTKHKLDLTGYTEKAVNSRDTFRFFELDFLEITSEEASKEEINKIKYRYKNFSRFLNPINSFLNDRKFFDYPIQFFLQTKDLYLDSYFQSERFFRQHRKEILSEFSLKKQLMTNDFKEIFHQINQEQDNLSIHFRRGDYVKNKYANKYHGVLDLQYYNYAIKQIASRKKINTIYVFSDDVDWVKKNFLLKDKEMVYISERGFNGPQEIILMSACKNNILANSSFSWWGAWLNKNEDKLVIAPKKWVLNNSRVNKDIIPKSWIKI